MSIKETLIDTYYNIIASKSIEGMETLADLFQSPVYANLLIKSQLKEHLQKNPITFSEHEKAQRETYLKLFNSLN